MHIYDEDMSDAAQSLPQSSSRVTSRGVKIASELREARESMVLLAKQGRMDEVMSGASSGPSARVYAVKVLDVHPAMGKVAGRRLMASLGVEPFTRIGDVPDSVIQSIVRACGGDS